MDPVSIPPSRANWLTPYLTVRDVDQSIAFYSRGFGFSVGNTMDDEQGHKAHVEMLYQGKIVIMFAPEGAWGGTQQAPKSTGNKPAVSLYIYCQDVDTVYRNALKAGAESVREPADMFWGDREASLIDPNGYSWSFATPVSTPKNS